VTTAAAPDLRDRLQDTLGADYALDRELGAGGMARVFAATEARTGRRVAVKVLAPAAAACCVGERFRREMALVASLDHAHIVPLLAECQGCGGDRLYYFVMPLVEGETLRARLEREGRLPVPEAVRILRQLASALAHAHGRGVVHRDLKPANVLLERDRDGDRALLADFGVAKAVLEATARAGGEPLDRPLEGAACGPSCADDRPFTPADGLTRVGFAVGTPAYMAPEQALAEPDADHRADLYALGVVAYEVLTGAPPFVDRDPGKVITAHVYETPVPVETRRSGVPAALAAVVSRLLAKDASARPASADEVLRALGEVP
jgi:eukaryotic-like serine/threonine-protein kinase